MAPPRLYLATPLPTMHYRISTKPYIMRHNSYQFYLVYAASPLQNIQQIIEIFFHNTSFWILIGPHPHTSMAEMQFQRI